MIKETVTISLDTYKHMERRIKNLEQAIEDLTAQKECVTWSRGLFSYSYWFYNPTEITMKVVNEMREISTENEELKAQLKKASPSRFYRFLMGE